MQHISKLGTEEEDKSKHAYDNTWIETALLILFSVGEAKLTGHEPGMAGNVWKARLASADGRREL